MKGFNLKADVLKVGHHGSSSSTTAHFLEKVNPKYAVICVGKNNDYGHPHEELIKRLAEKNIKIYRTDRDGTVIAVSDGKTVRFNKEPSTKTTIVTAKKEGQPNSTIVYITRTGTKYHRDGCPYLSKSKIPITLSEALRRGYSPCSKCRPPQK